MFFSSVVEWASTYLRLSLRWVRLQFCFEEMLGDWTLAHPTQWNSLKTKSGVLKWGGAWSASMRLNAEEYAREWLVDFYTWSACGSVPPLCVCASYCYMSSLLFSICRGGEWRNIAMLTRSALVVDHRLRNDYLSSIQLRILVLVKSSHWAYLHTD